MTRADFSGIFAAPTTPMSENEPRVPGAGLALSGGGYRAMIFHLGALRRLYEVGALTSFDRISSVSGGSIAAAQLALRWPMVVAGQGDPRVFIDAVQDPLMAFSETNLDVPAGIKGLVRPRRSIAQSVARTYDQWFEGKTLQDLPVAPRFVFCATNLGSGSLVRFAKPYTADHRIGKRDRLDLRLSEVVAASAAFPPVLSPMTIKLRENEGLTEQFEGDPTPELAGTSFAFKLELSDGGVYDNLGLQPLEKYETVLVSDGGGPFRPEDNVPSNWLQHMIRAWNTTDNQVRALRRGRLVDDFIATRRRGAFWGISTTYSEYDIRPLHVDDSWSEYFLSIPTRLAPMDDDVRKRLVNFSYCLTDCALHSDVLNGATVPPAELPFPNYPIDKRAGPFAKKPWWKFWG